MVRSVTLRICDQVICECIGYGRLLRRGSERVQNGRERSLLSQRAWRGLSSADRREGRGMIEPRIYRGAVIIIRRDRGHTFDSGQISGLYPVVEKSVVCRHRMAFAKVNNRKTTSS